MTGSSVPARTLSRVSDVPRLEVSGLSKTFGRTRVLENVALSVRPGEIHGLLGQNGSGKSTIIKVLSGLIAPDEGARVLIDGVEVAQPISPVRTGPLGLTIVHQSLGLIPGHTVTENIRLGQLRGRGLKRLINWREQRTYAATTLEVLQSAIDPDALVDHLHMGQRATVAIARALQGIVEGYGCVILDESTQSLPREVLPDFYRTLRHLATVGTSILIVSHRLEEVLEITDRVSILRDGMVAADGLNTGGLTQHSLATEILGRQLVELQERERFAPPPEENHNAGRMVRMRGVVGEALRGVDLDLRPGEVVGLTGETESGHEELPYLISGARPDRVSGSLELAGNTFDLSHLSVRDAQRVGIYLVPADRAGEALAMELSALENLTLPRVRSHSSWGWLRRAWQRTEFSQACKTLAITPADPDLPAGSFSGGNQQKLLLAKWMLSEPVLLVLHEPTQAVDVGARADLLRAISECALNGSSVLLSSIEATDLAIACDRVLVIGEGRIARELRAPMTAADIISATAMRTLRRDAQLS